MIELINALLAHVDNPLVVLAVFITAVIYTSSYHSLLRQVAIRHNRMCLFMVDKRWTTMQELQDRGLLTEVGEALSIMEGLV